MKPSHTDPAWDDPRITAYVLGELSDQERRELEQQMADNVALAAAVQEAQQIVDRVSHTLAHEPIDSLSSDRREAIMQTHPPASEMASPIDRPSWGRMALAASVLFLLGLGSGVLLPQLFAPSSRLASRGSAMADLLRPSDRAVDEPESVSAAPRTAAPAAAPEPADAIASRNDAAPSAAATGVAPPAEGQAGYGGGYGGGGYGGGYGGPVGSEKEESFRRSAGGYSGMAGSNAAGPTAGYGGGYGAASGNGGYSGAGYGAVSGYGPASGNGGYGGAGYSGAGYGAASGYGGGYVVPRSSRQPAGERPQLYGNSADLGHGPGMAGDRFDPITDNAFRRVEEHPLSTFSIDVDTASYAKVRSFLLDHHSLPRPDAVRIEELVNYFDYDYRPPTADAEHPFASRVEIAACPWNDQNRLARVAIKGREVARESRPAGNFVFLLDVSGSMNQPNKLPLVKRGMRLLLQELNDRDRIAIVVYAGAAGLVLDSTPCDRRAEVFAALDRLTAGGSTNGGDGIQLAYRVARDHFISGGVNRVILCTDGDFNVGHTGTDSLVQLVEDESKGGVYLSVLGFGMGNHNDAMLEQISGRGNGNYAFIDTESEARKVLVQQASGTLVTIAKDVKIQVEFNPAHVAAYRLIGYENRILAKEDFNDDTKDAGEIGAGHTVTALYELVPVGRQAEPVAPEVDPLRYQVPSRRSDAAYSDEVLTLKLRYKLPDGDRSTLVQFPASDERSGFRAASSDFQFAAAVAGFGMLLRNSPHKGDWTYAAVEQTARSARGDDPHGLCAEFIRLVRKAAELSGAERGGIEGGGIERGGGY